MGYVINKKYCTCLSVLKDIIPYNLRKNFWNKSNFKFHENKKKMIQFKRFALVSY